MEQDGYEEEAKMQTVDDQTRSKMKNNELFEFRSLQISDNLFELNGYEAHADPGSVFEGGVEGASQADSIHL